MQTVITEPKETCFVLEPEGGLCSTDCYQLVASCTAFLGLAMETCNLRGCIFQSTTKLSCQFTKVSFFLLFPFNSCVSCIPITFPCMIWVWNYAVNALSEYVVFVFSCKLTARAWDFTVDWVGWAGGARSLFYNSFSIRPSKIHFVSYVLRLSDTESLCLFWLLSLK